MEKEQSDASPLKLLFTFRPLTLTVPAEREKIFRKLQDHLAVVDQILAVSEDAKLKLRAIAVAVQLARASLGLLSDVELEKVEMEIKELKQKLASLRSSKVKADD